MSVLEQIDLNTLLVFCAIVETGSFTAAAIRLDVPKARVSVQMGRLELQLGSELLTRTTRKVRLTDAGRHLYEQCRPLLAGLQEAINGIGSTQEQLTGTLRISTTVNHAMQSVAPALAAFTQQHPGLHIDLRTSDQIRDMVDEGVDLTFRLGWLRDSSQRAIKLGEFRQYLVAAPAYLQQHGYPSHPDELRHREWISLTLLNSPLTWKFQHSDGQIVSEQMKSRIQVDSPTTLLALLINGAGISAIDELSVAAHLQSGELVRLLPDWTLATGGIYAVLPPGRYVPTRVRAFLDFYRDFIEGNTGAGIREKV